jgi:hypothetical protein
MSETSQNDWDVVADALASGEGLSGAEEAHARLREVSSFMISNLNKRITELEAELALRAPEEGWPVPAKLTEDYWESAQ